MTLIYACENRNAFIQRMKGHPKLLMKINGNLWIIIYGKRVCHEKGVFKIVGGW
jgi:hypothetical protein